MDNNDLGKINFALIAYQKKLALEFAQGLNDTKALPFHLSLVRRYPESFLREKYNEAMKKPLHEIITTRARYYNYLIHKDVKENINSIRN